MSRVASAGTDLQTGSAIGPSMTMTDVLTHAGVRTMTALSGHGDQLLPTSTQLNRPLSMAGGFKTAEYSGTSHAGLNHHRFSGRSELVETKQFNLGDHACSHDEQLDAGMMSLDSFDQLLRHLQPSSTFAMSTTSSVPTAGETMTLDTPATYENEPRQHRDIMAATAAINSIAGGSLNAMDVSRQLAPRREAAHSQMEDEHDEHDDPAGQFAPTNMLLADIMRSLQASSAEPPSATQQEQAAAGMEAMVDQASSAVGYHSNMMQRQPNACTTESIQGQFLHCVPPHEDNPYVQKLQNMREVSGNIGRVRSSQSLSKGQLSQGTAQASPRPRSAEQPRQTGPGFFHHQKLSSSRSIHEEGAPNSDPGKSLDSGSSKSGCNTDSVAQVQPAQDPHKSWNSHGGFVRMHTLGVAPIETSGMDIGAPTPEKSFESPLQQIMTSTPTNLPQTAATTHLMGHHEGAKQQDLSNASMRRTTSNSSGMDRSHQSPAVHKGAHLEDGGLRAQFGMHADMGLISNVVPQAAGAGEAVGESSSPQMQAQKAAPMLCAGDTSEDILKVSSKQPMAADAASIQLCSRCGNIIDPNNLKKQQESGAASLCLNCVHSDGSLGSALVSNDVMHSDALRSQATIEQFLSDAVDLNSMSAFLMTPHRSMTFPPTSNDIPRSTLLHTSSLPGPHARVNTRAGLVSRKETLLEGHALNRVQSTPIEQAAQNLQKATQEFDIPLASFNSLPSTGSQGGLSSKLNALALSRGVSVGDGNDPFGFLLSRSTSSGSQGTEPYPPALLARAQTWSLRAGSSSSPQRSMSGSPPSNSVLAHRRTASMTIPNQQTPPRTSRLLHSSGPGGLRLPSPASPTRSPAKRETNQIDWKPRYKRRKVFSQKNKSESDPSSLARNKDADGDEDHKADSSDGDEANRDDGSDPERIKPRSMAERQRRDRISAGLKDLREIIPPSVLGRGQRVDLTTVIGTAVKYIKILQARNDELEMMLVKSNLRFDM